MARKMQPANHSILHRNSFSSLGGFYPVCACGHTRIFPQCTATSCGHSAQVARWCCSASTTGLRTPKKAPQCNSSHNAAVCCTVEECMSCTKVCELAQVDFYCFLRGRTLLKLFGFDVQMKHLRMPTCWSAAMHAHARDFATDLQHASNGVIEAY